MQKLDINNRRNISMFVNNVIHNFVCQLHKNILLGKLFYNTENYIII